MGSIVATSWRIVVKRARASWPILTAALLTIVLATTLLSAGPIYAGAVAVSGLRRTLHDAPITKGNVQVTAWINARDFTGRDNTVTRVASQTFAATGGTIWRMGRSESFALPGQPPNAVKNLAVFGFAQQLDEHATLVSGAWPQVTSGGVEAAIPAPTAALLGLAPGAQLDLQSRLEPDHHVQVRISGIYRINDASDPFWWQNTLDTSGVDRGSSFDTYGPFMVPANVFLGDLSRSGVEIRWHIFPHFERLTVAQLAPLIGAVDSLNGRVNQGLSANDAFRVDTDLPNILRTAQRSLLVTRTGVLIVTVQLAILAGYALLLTSGLLVDQRRVETGLLHSRGASTAQIVTMAVMEALLLAVPAGFAGPWLAALSLHALNHIGPLATIGLPLKPEVTRDAYLLSFLAALACVVALAIPSLQSARSFVLARAARGRQLSRGLAQRAGIDLVLLAAAALAYWQLRRYGAPITETVQGKLGLDPFLVAAPAIGLLAGAVAALRLVPLAARLIERGAARQRTLVPSLSAWQVARRPLRYARAALLLMLAMAIGLFALSYGATWALSQQDQANYAVGADIRVRPDIRTGTAIPAMDLAQAHGQLPGVTATMPVARDVLQVSRSSGSTRMIALDSATADRIVDFRPDLASQPFATLMSDLSADRPKLPAIPLPGSPKQLAIDLRVALDPAAPSGGASGPAAGAGGQQPAQAPSAQLSVVVQDRRGLVYRLRSGSIPTDGSQQRVVLPLAFPMVNGQMALPEYPLAIAAVEVGISPPTRAGRTGMIDIGGILTGDQIDGPEQWTPAPFNGNDVGWSVDQYGLVEPAGVSATELPPAQGAATRFATGYTSRGGVFPVTYRLKPNGPAVPDTLPALVSEQFLSTTATRVGDTLPVELAGSRRNVLITGAIRGFPTLDPTEANIIVVDLPTLEMLKFVSDGGTLEAGEWWLSTAPGKESSVARALSAAPYFTVEVHDRIEQGTTLRNDPVALGIIGALSLGFVAAALFAAIGFAVSSAVSARERLAEFALLRAVGLSTGQLSGWLSLENGALVVASLVAGTLLGLVLAWLILPLVSLTQAAARTLPGVIVVVPWKAVVILEATSLVALVVVIAVLAAALRRIGLGSTLRLGEE